MTLLRGGRHVTAGWAARASHSVLQLRAAHLQQALQFLQRRDVRGVHKQTASRPTVHTVALAYQDGPAEDIRTAATPRVATFHGLSGDHFRSCVGIQPHMITANYDRRSVCTSLISHSGRHAYSAMRQHEHLHTSDCTGTRWTSRTHGCCGCCPGWRA